MRCHREMRPSLPTVRSPPRPQWLTAIIPVIGQPKSHIFYQLGEGFAQGKQSTGRFSKLPDAVLQQRYAGGVQSVFIAGRSRFKTLQSGYEVKCWNSLRETRLESTAKSRAVRIVPILTAVDYDVVTRVSDNAVVEVKFAFSNSLFGQDDPEDLRYCRAKIFAD